MAVKILLGAIVVLLLAHAVWKWRGDTSGSDAHDLVADGALLVDVRTPEEFAAGHIAGALNVPVQELDQRMTELGPRERAIVVYCRSGNRSSRAAGQMKSAGYQKVHDLGAMSRW
jgi:rhodanese-related sulfurtransferase